MRQLRQRYEALSYVIDWKEAFCEASELDVEVCNINNLVEYFHRLRSIREYRLIIILHSAAGDNMSILLRTVEWFNRRRGKLVVFIANEYSLMVEKVSFIRLVKADYVCSQLTLEPARWLYAECTHSKVLSMPHALNPKLYFPNSNSKRNIDIGFIGTLYHNIIGDKERTNLVYFFERHGADLGLICNIRTQNVSRYEWSQFLNNCKGIIGAESGTYYLDRDGKVMVAAEAYLKVHPEASFEEVFENIFKDRTGYISGKMISSRHFEPIGTKTCQILLEGDYNGILLPDEHYISVKKDLSNIDNVVQRFKDEDYRRRMVERTYEYVMSGHTYQHRIKALLKVVVNEGN